MKKHIFLCIVLAAVMMCFTASVWAAGNGVSELPDVKIIIDGEIGTYKDIPITVSDRTLLPLREILTNLGVKNDNEHIIWNGKESSVTIIKDSQKIYLKIGSDKATVNGEEVVLDTKPVLYKNKTYIPVRFVAQSLGKKVIWDGGSKSVLIRDEAEFTRVQNLLKKMDNAMNATTSYQMDIDSSTAMKVDGVSTPIDYTLTSKFDSINKNMYMNMQMNILGTKLGAETYSVDNVEYSKDPGSDKWVRKELAEEESNEKFEENSKENSFDPSDVLSAGLKEIESENPDEILLKGEVLSEDLFEMATFEDKKAISGYKFDKFNVEISLDKNTYLLNKWTMTATYKLDAGSSHKINISIEVVFSDFNSDIQIEVPKEVLESAVEA